jgi:hypothetical protein
MNWALCVWYWQTTIVRYDIFLTFKQIIDKNVLIWFVVIRHDEKKITIHFRKKNELIRPGNC